MDEAKDCSEQRGEVSFCLNFLVALLRRISVPTDLLKCRNSGFIDTSVTEVLALKSPAGGVGVHVLSTILKLTKTFIEMFKARHNPALSKVFDMLSIEKNTVQGQSGNDNDRLVIINLFIEFVFDHELRQEVLKVTMFFHHFTGAY